jgi:uncharacterized repeat protein (TIGR03803 family)
VAGDSSGISSSAAAQFTRASFAPAPDASTFRTLHIFVSTPDGANPAGNLLDVGGTFYGTTRVGGTNNWGTVFRITSSGKESVLDSFIGGDGGNPLAGLIDVNGTLYGTTFNGGASSLGTVFAITPAGKERVLHSFGSGSDGLAPQAGLVDVDGVLYGTTTGGGGTSGAGTVFSITPSGTETVLHNFSEHSSDGYNPTAALVDLNGTLYGTTEFGGITNGGTVFAITPSGSESVLYNFRGYHYSDGAFPLAGLVNDNGVLYGTTEIGGAYCSKNSSGCGTVFKITTSGAESVLHSFKAEADGIAPVAGLIDVKGALYGTASYTAFKLTTSGKLTVLHTFSGPDGGLPVADLTEVGGTLYGTAFYGGPASAKIPHYNCEYDGCGTVFSLAP